MPAQANVKADLTALLERKDFAALKRYLEPWLPADIAPIISELPVETLAALFRASSRELAATTFAYLEHAGQHKLLKLLNPEQAAALLAPDAALAHERTFSFFKQNLSK